MPMFFFKRLQLFINIPLLCIALSACSDENEPIVYYTTLGTVEETSGRNIIVSDSYGTLIPENGDFLTAKNADSIGQRVLAGIQFLKGNPPKETSEKISQE